MIQCFRVMSCRMVQMVLHVVWGRGPNQHPGPHLCVYTHHTQQKRKHNKRQQLVLFTKTKKYTQVRLLCDNDANKQHIFIYKFHIHRTIQKKLLSSTFTQSNTVVLHTFTQLLLFTQTITTHTDSNKTKQNKIVFLTAECSAIDSSINIGTIKALRCCTGI